MKNKSLPKKSPKTLDSLGKYIHNINFSNGWDVPRSSDWQHPLRIPAILALIHSELSEALEAFRHGDAANFREEIADVVIRTLDLTYGMNIDITKEVLKKCEKNKKRGWKHGGKRI